MRSQYASCYIGYFVFYGYDDVYTTDGYVYINTEEALDQKVTNGN